MIQEYTVPTWATATLCADAFAEGKRAFKEGRHDNPYHPDKQFDEHREWARGYNRGYFNALRKRQGIERYLASKRNAA